VTEAAKIAMVSPPTIRTWIADERVKAVLYAGRWWITRDSLSAMTAEALP
jgi:hypothetical protein